MARVGVPKVVPTDLRQAGLASRPLEVPSDVLGSVAAPVLSSEHEPLVAVTGAPGQSLDGLCCLVRAQDGDGRGVQADRAHTLLGLGGSCHHHATDLGALLRY